MDMAHYEFTNTMTAIAGLPGIIEELKEEFDIGSSVAAGINLALEEAMVNAINYAYPPGQTGPINLDVSFDPPRRMLHFELTDRGVPFDPTGAAPADTDAPLEERRIGGLGIHLIRTLMDSVEYTYAGGCNILRMSASINPEYSEESDET